MNDLWAQIDVVEVGDVLVRQAAELAHRLALRGYDAVHCAAAHQLDDPDLVAATGTGAYSMRMTPNPRKGSRSFRSLDRSQKCPRGDLNPHAQ
jgi:hypothetical protein